MALPKTILLQMEIEDIEGAICRSRKHCAIAQTIYRQLEIPVGRVRVMTSGVSIVKEDYRYYYKVPTKACRLVRDFDDEKPVDPIKFRLRFTNRSKIQPVDDARKAAVNKARREASAAAIALGEKPKRYSTGRYGI